MSGSLHTVRRRLQDLGIAKAKLCKALLQIQLHRASLRRLPDSVCGPVESDFPRWLTRPLNTRPLHRNSDSRSNMKRCSYSAGDLEATIRLDVRHCDVRWIKLVTRALRLDGRKSNHRKFLSSPRCIIVARRSCEYLREKLRLSLLRGRAGSSLAFLLTSHFDMRRGGARRLSPLPRKVYRCCSIGHLCGYRGYHS